MRPSSVLALSFTTSFQFTHPGKGATRNVSALKSSRTVSIHAPWEGCDLYLLGGSKADRLFQFTHPGKGATVTTFPCCFCPLVSIHAPWEGCDYICPNVPLYAHKVSIHAPWEGCDLPRGGYQHDTASFNSRTLGRVRPCYTLRAVVRGTFQFTHPGKGATFSCLFCTTFAGSFNSRTLGRVRLFRGKVIKASSPVSIHAPWEGCDEYVSAKVEAICNVSIHAPWEGCD